MVQSLHSSALCLLASVDQTRLCMSPSGSLLFHRLLSRSRSLCRKSPDGCNEKFSSHSHSTYFLHTHSQAYMLTTHTQCGKLGCLSTWNDYSSSNERAAGWVFIDYSLNRDGQANTPARMSVFSSGCVWVCVCLYAYAAYFFLDSFRHSRNESHRHHPLMAMIAINQTSTAASLPWLNGLVINIIKAPCVRSARPQ